MNNIITEEEKIDANGDGNDNNIDNKDTRALNENINNNKIRNHEILYQTCNSLLKLLNSFEITIKTLDIIIKMFIKD